MRLEFNECVKIGLLRKIPPSSENARKSIEKAEALIEEAQENHEHRAYAASLLLAYTAMFHSARALLLQDGWREKSHACVARYVEEKYVKTGLLEQKWIDVLDRFRELRHADLYDFDFRATEKQASEALVTSKLFCQRMKKLVR